MTQGTLHPRITSSVCTRYREMLILEKTTPDKEGSLTLGSCTGNERSDRAHIPGHRGNRKMSDNNIKDNMLIQYIVTEEYLNIPQYM